MRGSSRCARSISSSEENRIILLFAAGDEGQSLPATLRDLGDTTWLELSTPALLRRRQVAAAPHPNGTAVLFYGGIDSDGVETGGLYQVPLDPMALVGTSEVTARLDGGQEVTPGVRVGAALAPDRYGRFVYLYGGQRAGETLRDLWRYSVATGTWERLSDGSEVGAPPAMAVTHLLVSPVDGSLLIISGTAATDPETQRRSYRLRDGLWTSDEL